MGNWVALKVGMPVRTGQWVPDELSHVCGCRGTAGMAFVPRKSVVLWYSCVDYIEGY